MTRSRSPLVVVGVLVVVAFAIATLVSGGDDPPSATETAPVAIEGAALAPFDPADDPAIGSPAPSVSGVSFDDAPVAVTEPGSRVYGFFAHWCPHCQRELPIVEEWLDEGLLPTGVGFVAISTAVEPGADNHPPSAWFEQVGYDGTVLVDDADSSVADAFGLTAFPYWVVTDADGDVVFRTTGGVDRSGFIALGELAAG